MPPSLLFLAVFLVAAAAGDDASVMLRLRDGLKPKPSGWSASDHCMWDGVECDSNHRVVSINMASKALSGSLPPNLNALTKVTSLFFQKNNLSGPFPSLAQLSLLQHASFDHNQFTSIPSGCFGGLTSLMTLSISHNGHLRRWFFPTELLPEGQLSSLVYLGARKTNMHGPLPDFFDSFPNLQEVRLSQNNLVGFLPKTFVSSGIETLRLDNQASGLTGTLEVVAEMRQLTQVWLQNNQFTGPIPDLSKCVALWDLQLADNMLTGVVPATLMSWLTSLRNVSLDNNNLQGPLPVFGSSNVTKAATFGGTNNFCRTTAGPCDPQVTTMLKVAEGLGYPLLLAQSWRGNDVCTRWRIITCSHQMVVSVVDFHGKHFGGVISPFLANLTFVQNLNLSGNNLVGSIPESLASLSTLEVIDVSDNQLSGLVPQFATHVRVIIDGNPRLTRISEAPHAQPSPSPSPSASPSPLSTGAIIGITMLIVVVIMICTLGLAYFASEKQKMPETETGFVGAKKFPLQVLRDATSDFSAANLLGRGGFSSVFKGVMEDGSTVAVKKMETKHYGRLDAKALKSFKSEVKVLNSIRHANLVSLIGYYEDKQHLILVYEYLSQGTLGNHLFNWREERLQPLDWSTRLKIALNIARGVEHIHKYANQKLVHRDLKPANILLGEDFTAKVADFGLVRLCSSRNRSSSPLTQPAGTPGYWAPESLAGSASDKADVYSFGVILMELITGKRVVGSHWTVDDVNLVTWFRKLLTNDGSVVQIDKAALAKAVDGEINSTEEETVSCFLSVAELAIHCTEREPDRRPDMSHAVMELSRLAEKPWKPSEPIVDDNPLTAKSLPEAMCEWEKDEASTSESLPEAMCEWEKDKASTSESRTTRRAGGGKDEEEIREEDG